MFLSEVDHEKYPNVTQEYRFEKIKAVPLKLISDAIEMASDEWHQFLDIEEMEIVSIPDDPYLFYDGKEAFEELTDKIDTDGESEIMSSIDIRKIGITDLDTDCIVNAANSSLTMGSGVCGAIFRAAEAQL